MAAASELFARRGYANVSMSSVAGEVGITPGALYRHLDGKQALLAAVFQDQFAFLDVPVDDDDVVSAVEAAGSRLAEQPYLADLWLHELRYLPSDDRAALLDLMGRWWRPLDVALLAERPELTSRQAELLVASVRSVLWCLARRSIHVPSGVREPVVRAAAAELLVFQFDDAGEDEPEPERSLRVPVSLRERLLLAAADRFGRGDGYHETSMVAIGRAAGVTGASLYVHFDSKASLLQAVHERGIHQLWIGLGSALAHAAGAAEALAGAISSFVEVASGWAATLDDPTLEADLDPGSLDAQREYVAELVELLREADPGLDRRAARIRVQIALFVVMDLFRDPLLDSDSPLLLSDVSALAVAVVLPPALRNK